MLTMLLHYEIDRISPVLISKGNVYTSGNTGVARDLDPFALHDSVLITFSFLASLKSEASLVVAGIFPDLKHAFRLKFRNYSDLCVNNVSFDRQFGVKRLSVSKQDDYYLVSLTGEFAGQEISLRCEDAEYEKFLMETPLSRSNMGW